MAATGGAKDSNNYLVCAYPLCSFLNDAQNSLVCMRGQKSVIRSITVHERHPQMNCSGVKTFCRDWKKVVTTHDRRKLPPWRTNGSYNGKITVKNAFEIQSKHHQSKTIQNLPDVSRREVKCGVSFRACETV